VLRVVFAGSLRCSAAFDDCYEIAASNPALDVSERLGYACPRLGQVVGW